MRIGIAQINPTLGDFEANAQKILKNIKDARARKCDLIIFPEAALLGYHPYDLLERSEFIERQNKQLQKIIKSVPAGISVLLGVIQKK